jgi:hypothetical protein
MAVAAALLMIVGSIVFGVGASIGVPRVFTTADPEARLRLLEERPTAWRYAQPLYVAGPLIVAVGVGLIPGSAAFVIASVLLTMGVLAWAYSCYRRAVSPEAFARGELPGLPFTAYVLLTIAGLALTGSGLLIADYPGWIGWVVLVADAVFLVAYVVTRDIPPFVFYLVTLLVGVVIAAES